MIQQWDFQVDKPVSLPAWRRHRLGEQLPHLAARIARGETLRTVAADHGISHETPRQALKRQGHATRPTPTPGAFPRRGRIHRLPGRGGSTALAPDELAVLFTRHQAGESMCSLARTYGASHETVRRSLAQMSDTDIRGATA